MKKSPRRLSTAVTAMCLFCAALPGWGGPEEASPNLLAAMKDLETAKTAPDPGPSLQDALKYLNKATNNAGGKRGMAISYVNDAVKMDKDADKTEMIAKIDHAITELHEGMDRGGHHHRR